MDKKVEALLNCEYKEIKDIMSKALEYHNLFETGKINVTEYDDLINDLLLLDHLDTNMDNLKFVKLIDDLINVIKTLRSLSL